MRIKVPVALPSAHPIARRVFRRLVDRPRISLCFASNSGRRLFPDLLYWCACLHLVCFLISWLSFYFHRGLSSIDISRVGIRRQGEFAIDLAGV